MASYFKQVGYFKGNIDKIANAIKGLNTEQAIYRMELAGCSKIQMIDAKEELICSISDFVWSSASFALEVASFARFPAFSNHLDSLITPVVISPSMLAIAISGCASIDAFNFCNAKENLSLVESEELAKLKETNKELERESIVYAFHQRIIRFHKISNG